MESDRGKKEVLDNSLELQQLLDDIDDVSSYRHQGFTLRICIHRNHLLDSVQMVPVNFTGHGNIKTICFRCS
jgi:hypothetical protein